MPEIMPWNNAFSGSQGSGGNIAVVPQNLPNGGNAFGDAFASTMGAVGAAGARRQNMLMQKEQMDMARQKFAYEIGQDMLNMQMQQRKMQQSKLFGTIFNNNVNKDTGEVNFTGVIADMAEVPELSDVAPDAAIKMLEARKTDYESVKLRLDSNEKMHTAIGYRAGVLLEKAQKEGRYIQTGEVAQAIAEAVATGDITKDYASALVKHMQDPTSGALHQQVKSLFENSTQSADSIKRLSGELQLVNSGGQTDIIRSKPVPGGFEIEKEGFVPQQPTVEDKSKPIETIVNGQRVQQRIGDTPLAPVPGGEAPMPGAEGKSNAGMVMGDSPEMIASRAKDEEEFRQRLKLANEQAETANSQLANLFQAKEALKDYNPGSGQSWLMPLAKVLDTAGAKDWADTLAGGDLSAAEVFNASAIKSAFAAIRSLGVTNKDLSGPELKQSERSTFSPDQRRDAALKIIKFMTDYNKMMKTKQNLMSKYYEEYYKKDPQKYPLSRAEAVINAGLAKKEGWVFGGSNEE
jgi:hypothetical protein